MKYNNKEEEGGRERIMKYNFTCSVTESMSLALLME